MTEPGAPDSHKATLHNFNEKLFGSNLPWYDSPWLQTFMAVRGYLAEKHPDRLGEFDALLTPLRTLSDFQANHLPGFVDEETLNALRSEVELVVQQPMSEYERDSFGRDLLHNRPAFTDLAHRLADKVAQLVGEAVEPCYNFLSLYGPQGTCEPHMDAPTAKWTLDICIAQSDRWPLHVSPVVPWPQEWDSANNADWKSYIRSNNEFASITMEPADAAIFAGSSQWHYRDPFPRPDGGGFCHLLFLHYIPTGCSNIVNPESWAELLGLPMIERLVRGYRSRLPTNQD